MILAVNTGSASKKYALYEEEREVFKLHIEKENDKFLANIESDGRKEVQEITSADFDDGPMYFTSLAISKSVIKDKSEIDRIGVRVVAPGDYFMEHNLIDDAYYHHLTDALEEAPLHIVPVLKEIKELKKEFAGTPMIAISDSAFHATMPPVSKTYGLPREMAQKYELHRFGFHGTSVRSVLRRGEKLFGGLPAKIIVCHLGSGASITAVKEGKSFDTSMGFTPLEGLLMGTRGGDLDPGTVIYLSKKLGLGPKEMDEFLNNKCGLLGISARSADVRDLLKAEEGGDKNAKLALEVFVYRIKKYIGSYAAALGGIDALVFTATLGERSWIMRGRICEGLSFFGITLDDKKNREAVSKEAVIHLGSGAKIAVIPTNELGEIAREASRINI